MSTADPRVKTVHLHHSAPGKPVRDPVCGMSVDPATTLHRAEHAGHRYYFCSAKCRDRFTAAPARYAAPDPVQPPPLTRTHVAGQTLWTCPMHPQIVRTEPGSCPICGMALEPMTPTGSDAENPELADMTRRFWVAAALSVPLLVLAMGGDLVEFLPMTARVWLQLALATPAVLWGGAPFFRRGWDSLRNRRLNMFTLIALGTGVAYLYSLVAALLPGLFPTSFRMPDGGVPVYFEAASVIVALVLLGQVLELRARAQTGSAIRALLDLAPRS